MAAVSEAAFAALREDHADQIDTSNARADKTTAITPVTPASHHTPGNKKQTTQRGKR